MGIKNKKKHRRWCRIAFRLEISTRPDLINARGASMLKRIKNELDIPLESVYYVTVFTIDADLNPEQLNMLKELVFTDPISEIASYEKLKSKEEFDVLIEVGWKPGLTDNAARVAQEAFRDIGITLGLEDKIYSSIQYRIKGVDGWDLEPEEIASRLLANPLVQRWQIRNYSQWTSKGVPISLPRAAINSPPEIEYIDLGVKPEELLTLSFSSQWGLNTKELQAIVEYFEGKGVARRRKELGLEKMPTNAEMESLAQTWSEHCKHKQFNALIHFRGANCERYDINSLFDTYIKGATRKIMETRPWIKSVFWDNAGVMEFNKDWLFCLKCETHNSPSNMEGYGGAITGIVGVYRDPMGTGMGARIVFGYYGFVVGPQDFHGELSPPQHPKVLLERVRKGVEDGGNKHGVPTPYGRVFFDESYLGKCIILVAAGGMIPARVNGKPGWEKKVEPGDLIVMAGGRIGVDGIHGATVSSRPFDDTTPAGHIQIGDPYMQKKLMDMLHEARDEGLYNFVQDNGAGGLNSSVGETASYCGKRGGCVLYLDRAPLKYPNLNPWEILVSESQERMTFAVPPENISAFQRLARKHDVEATVLGEFVDSGTFHVKFGEETVVYLEMEFLHEGVPQMELDACEVAKKRYPEPKLGEDKNYSRVLMKMLSRPNICSREYIIRQFDHEVQGGSVIKPLVGAHSDVESDSVVIRPTHQGSARSMNGIGNSPRFVIK